MRPQKRPDEPAILKDHGAAWSRAWLKRRKTNRSAQFDWPKIARSSPHFDSSGERTYANHFLIDPREGWWTPLQAMTQGHCAFCDCHWRMDRNGKETVEHFRPKSDPRFLHLAFTWTNLYLACGECQDAKGGKWDDAKTYLTPDSGYKFDEHFGINSDGELLRLTPEARNVSDLYKLNRPKLQRCRTEVMKDWKQKLDAGMVLEANDFPYRDFLSIPPLSPSAYRQAHRLA